MLRAKPVVWICATAVLHRRPLSCYSGTSGSRLTAERADLQLEEELTTCTLLQDVCYGRVSLTVSNTSDTRSALDIQAVRCNEFCYRTFYS